MPEKHVQTRIDLDMPLKDISDSWLNDNVSKDGFDVFEILLETLTDTVEGKFITESKAVKLLGKQATVLNMLTFEGHNKSYAKSAQAYIFSQMKVLDDRIKKDIKEVMGALKDKINTDAK